MLVNQVRAHPMEKKPAWRELRRRQGELEAKIQRRNELTADMTEAKTLLGIAGKSRDETERELKACREKIQSRSLWSDLRLSFANDPERANVPQLEARLKEARAAFSERYMRFAGIRNRVTRLDRDIAEAREKLSRLEGAAREESAALARLDSQRALVARAAAADRLLASEIRRKTPPATFCPYCGGPLDSEPHLDHIYPLRQGGLSVETNLVWACSTCNLRKHDLTLNEFVEKYNLDRDAIFDRLRSLGKRY